MATDFDDETDETDVPFQLQGNREAFRMKHKLPVTRGGDACQGKKRRKFFGWTGTFSSHNIIISYSIS